MEVMHLHDPLFHSKYFVKNASGLLIKKYQELALIGHDGSQDVFDIISLSYKLFSI